MKYQIRVSDFAKQVEIDLTEDLKFSFDKENDSDFYMEKVVKENEIKILFFDKRKADSKAELTITLDPPSFTSTTSGFFEYLLEGWLPGLNMFELVPDTTTEFQWPYIFENGIEIGIPSEDEYKDTWIERHLEANGFDGPEELEELVGKVVEIHTWPATYIDPETGNEFGIDDQTYVYRQISKATTEYFDTNELLVKFEFEEPVYLICHSPNDVKNKHRYKMCLEAFEVGFRSYEHFIMENPTERNNYRRIGKRACPIMTMRFSPDKKVDPEKSPIYEVAISLTLDGVQLGN